MRLMACRIGMFRRSKKLSSETCSPQPGCDSTVRENPMVFRAASNMGFPSRTRYSSTILLIPSDPVRAFS